MLLPVHIVFPVGICLWIDDLGGPGGLQHRIQCAEDGLDRYA